MDNLEPEIQDTPEVNSGDPKQLLERYKNQVKGSKEEALKQKERADKTHLQNIKIASKAVESDNEYIKTLKEEDPELADEVAREFDGEYENAEQLIKDLFSDNPAGKSEQKKSLADRVAEKVLAQLNQSTVQSNIEQKFSHLGEDKRKLAKEKFETYRAGRNLDQNQATELAEMVTLHLQKDSLIETAKTARSQQYGNLNLGGVSYTPSQDERSGADIAKTLGFDYLYTNKK